MKPNWQLGLLTVLHECEVYDKELIIVDFVSELLESETKRAYEEGFRKGYEEGNAEGYKLGNSTKNVLD